MVDKEQEIRLQFLDEAGEYLDTLESALLGVAQRGVDSHEINGALRAAHSIKGGAALMGYQLTSELAHRLEDSLKVLKIQRGEGVSSDVEGQLLSGVDAIRQIVERDRASEPIDETWVNNSVLPIFEGLYDTLGEPSAEDAASIMDADEGQNVMPLIFQTEVEGSLERLEALIDEQPPTLQADLATMAQELSGLGEMLDLPPFIQLCESVERFALGATSPRQIKEVADKTLQTWRRAQALVLTDNVESMPNQLTGVSFGMIDIELDHPELGQTGSNTLNDLPLEDRPLDGDIFAGLGEEDDALVGNVFSGLGEEDDALVGDVFSGLGEEDDALVGDVFSGLGEEDDALVGDVFSGLSDAPDEGAAAGNGTSNNATAPFDPSASLAGESASSEEDAFAGIFDEEETLRNANGGAASAGVFGTSGPQQAEGSSSGGTQFRFSGASQAKTESAPDLGDNTVRVSVRKLNELNDYFGEMTIERNRLEAEIKRMRGLVSDLSRRLRSLDEINDDVRDLYEQPVPQRLLAGRTIQALPGTANGLGNGSVEGLNIGTDAGFVGNSDSAQPGFTQPGSTQSVSEPAASGEAAPPPENRSSASRPSASPASTQGASSTRGEGAFRKEFDSLEFDSYNDAHLPFRQIVESVVRLQEVADDIELSVEKTEQTTRVIHRTARHLQRNLNQLRMRPLSDVTNRFPRALRELELKHGKSVELALDGENILIDRNILESLNDPLMHIVRNAFDHGIETPAKREAQGKSGQGTISISAQNRGGRTMITVSDDGNGIALDKIRDRARSMGLDADLLETASDADLMSLIFEPGFTTSEQVTDLSGRGVGMDVVRNNLTQIRGDISVDTEVGKGTTFTISVPYSLSVTRVMLAEGNRMPVALPTDMIEEVAIIDEADIYQRDDREMFQFKGEAVRLIRLSTWLAFNCPRQIDSLDEVPTMDGPSILIFRMGEQRMGLQIDRSWSDQEVAVRRVEGPISLPAGFSNCTILGDGKVVPLVNLPDLARWVLNCEGSDIHSADALYSNPVVNGAIDPVSLQSLPEAISHTAKFLVIDDSVNVRRLLALTLEKAGYEVEQARDGQDAFEKLETGMDIDSIVCDVEMPRMDGYSFLSKLRSNPRYADVPVTMLTSRSGEKHRTLAMNLGATAYFSKPYQERVLLESLKKSLKASRQAAAPV
ncbi:MAG: response regulator [Cyanobacteria bacterium P01_F01_bin.53]